MVQWANEFAQNGPGAFYRPDAGYFADYPPLYLYVLWATGPRAPGSAPEPSRVLGFVLQLPYILADLAAPGFSSCSSTGRGVASGRCGSCTVPVQSAIVLISTIWGQNDPVATAAVWPPSGSWPLAASSGPLPRPAWPRSSSSSTGSWSPIVASCSFGARFRFDRAHRGLVEGPRAGSPGCRDVLICLPFGLLPIAPGDPAHSLADAARGSQRGLPGTDPECVQPLDEPDRERHPVRAEQPHRGSRGGRHCVAHRNRWPRHQRTVAGQRAVRSRPPLVALLFLRHRDDALAVCFVALTIAVAFFDLPTRIHERYLYPAVALVIPFLWARAHVAPRIRRPVGRAVARCVLGVHAADRQCRTRARPAR